MLSRRSFALFAALLLPAVAHAGFLDLDTVTAGPGGFGSFTGTLDGVTVSGVLDGSGPALVNGGTTDNSSPQFSYPAIYAPSTPLADQVNYGAGPGGSFVQGFTITFGSPVTDPVFHIAGISRKGLDFSATTGLTSLTLLSGNGGVDGDGLGIAGNTIIDLNPATPQITPPDTSPATTGDRAAYGSVQLKGTFSTLVFTFTNDAPGGGGGSFTLSAAPVPAPAASTAGLALLGASLLRRNRRGA
jgi:hypothetical protein